MHLPRPIYEGLPWLYIALGLAALGASWRFEAHAVPSAVAGLGGLAAVIAGVVLLLRRRDFRDLDVRYPQRRDGRIAGSGRSDPPRGQDGP